MSAINFRVLQSSSRTGLLAEWTPGAVMTEKVFCPLDAGHQRGGKRLTDLSVWLPRGPVHDFVWTWYSECLMQDRVLSLFRKEGFTGFEARPITARFQSDLENEPPRLWELILTGWGGIARDESGIRRVEYCPACQHTVYSGLKDASCLIDIRQWDGSDFFLVWPMPRYVFVTDRVAQCILEHRLTGIVVNRVERIEPTHGFTPGRLSYQMPASRARVLGKAAGITEV